MVRVKPDPPRWATLVDHRRLDSLCGSHTRFFGADRLPVAGDSAYTIIRTDRIAVIEEITVWSTELRVEFTEVVLNIGQLPQFSEVGFRMTETAPNTRTVKLPTRAGVIPPRQAVHVDVFPLLPNSISFTEVFVALRIRSPGSSEAINLEDMLGAEG